MRCGAFFEFVEWTVPATDDGEEADIFGRAWGQVVAEEHGGVEFGEDLGRVLEER